MAKKKPDSKQVALAKIKDLTIGDAETFFDSRASARDKQIAEMVATDDELECTGAVVSEGDENGAFVMTWTWVDFSGTALDKYCTTCCGDGELKTIEMRDGTTERLCESCLEQVTCPECSAVEGTEKWGTVGDGYDGYCPSCADKREEDGVYGE